MRTTQGSQCEKDPDARVLRLAARQHGVVTRQQALSAGLTKSMIQTRLRLGHLERVHPGVFCVTGAPRTFKQRAFAAVAWAGPGAVASHCSAGHLWRIIEKPPAVDDVWTPRKRTRPPGGVRAHFTCDLARRDRGKLWNIPVTSPARTLIDLAGVLPEHQVETALAYAIAERRLTAAVLKAKLRQMSRQGVRGPRVLRRFLVETSGRPHALSPLERKVADVLRGGDLPPFHREYPVYVDGGVYYLDFAWPHFRVGVEADGRRWHSDGPSFERDRERHNALTGAGWKVLRVTERQVRGDPHAVRDRVRGLLVRG